MSDTSNHAKTVTFSNEVFIAWIVGAIAVGLSLSGLLLISVTLGLSVSQHAVLVAFCGLFLGSGFVAMAVGFVLLCHEMLNHLVKNCNTTDD